MKFRIGLEALARGFDDAFLPDNFTIEGDSAAGRGCPIRDAVELLEGDRSDRIEVRDRLFERFCRDEDTVKERTPAFCLRRGEWDAEALPLRDCLFDERRFNEEDVLHILVEEGGGKESDLG